MAESRAHLTRMTEYCSLSCCSDSTPLLLAAACWPPSKAGSQAMVSRRQAVTSAPTGTRPRARHAATWACAADGQWSRGVLDITAAAPSDDDVRRARTRRFTLVSSQQRQRQTHTQFATKPPPPPCAAASHHFNALRMVRRVAGRQQRLDARPLVPAGPWDDAAHAAAAAAATARAAAAAAARSGHAVSAALRALQLAEAIIALMCYVTGVLDCARAHSCATSSIETAI